MLGALKNNNAMNTALFLFAALVGVTALLAYLLRKWVKTNIGSRHPRAIAPGEGFLFYEYGQPRCGVCDVNYPCIEVIYTTDNRRVEYKDVSKL